MTLGSIAAALRRNRVAAAWTAAALALAAMVLLSGGNVGWDLHVYHNAMVSLQAGHDPYLDGMAVQQIYHRQPTHPPGAPPYTYVYSPITLPLLRVVSMMPERLCASVYWLTYIVASVAAIVVGCWMAEGEELPIFAVLAPAALFFPGLLRNDVILSGNVAYILYGFLLWAALRGWRGKGWAWFYPVVLLASCAKAPLLSLVAIPVLSARRQWLPALATSLLGVMLFALQPIVWPEIFRHYLQAVELQFSYNHDFSCSPVGLLSDALFDVVAYQKTSAIFYPISALCFGAVLLRLRAEFLKGRIRLKQWLPFMLTGVVLLNPRVMEYDVAPITLPLALLLWRVSGRGRALCVAGMLAEGVFCILNLLAPPQWRTIECCTLVALFFCSAWLLWTDAKRMRESLPHLSTGAL